MMRRKVLSSGSIVGVIAGYSVFCSFARNVAIARLIGPAEFGVAVILGTIASAIDILSDMGWDKFLIQNAEGHRPEALSVVHLLKLASGIAFAAMIVLLAPVLADAMEKPAAAFPLALLAVPALFRASMNVDYRRRQREFDFRGEAWVEGGRYTADVVVAIVAALVFKSYWAMYYAIMAGALTSWALSHMLATTPYRLHWHKVIGVPALAFGLPLFANNLIVYGAGQGDRLLVGLGIDLKTLAVYAATLTLVAGTQVVINRLIISVGLPYLSSKRDDEEGYQSAFLKIGAVVAFAVTLVLVPVALVGADVVSLFFGAPYRPSENLVLAIAIAQCLNMVRVWPTVGLMARGKTRTIPLANVVRLLGLALGAGALAIGHGIVTVAYCVAAGELAGAVSALLWHHRAAPGRPTAVFTLLSSLVVIVLVAWALATVVPDIAMLRAAVAIVTCIMIVLVAILLLHPPSRNRLKHIVGLARRRIF